MTNEPSWLDLAKELEQSKHSAEPLRADWFAFQGSEDYGVWILRPGGLATAPMRAAFSAFAACAIGKLGIPPIRVPQPCEHFPDWRQSRPIEQGFTRGNREAVDLSDCVPYGLGTEDHDAVDAWTRAWLEWLRRNSELFQSSEDELWAKGQIYKTLEGAIEDVWAASVTSFRRLARTEIESRQTERFISAVVGDQHRGPAAGAKPGTRKARRKSLQLESLRKEVREMRRSGLTQREMCRRLSGRPRPPSAEWAPLDWPDAYRHKKFGASVRKWLSSVSI